MVLSFMIRIPMDAYGFELGAQVLLNNLRMVYGTRVVQTALETAMSGYRRSRPTDPMSNFFFDMGDGMLAAIQALQGKDRWGEFVDKFIRVAATAGGIPIVGLWSMTKPHVFPPQYKSSFNLSPSRKRGDNTPEGRGNRRAGGGGE